MKRLFILSSCIAFGNVLFAQNIEDGKKFLDYEKYSSAYNIFSKLVAANPNDAEATYWLGQTYLQNDDRRDTVAAKNLYQKALQATPNQPLLMAGMGEVQLMQGDKTGARNTFETAIGLAGKKDQIEVLKAVARANIDSKEGDAVYAIDKLNMAADKDKKNKDAEIQIELGNAYRKMVDGGNATKAYQAALAIDPKAARADFMTGRIYETQGPGQEPIYMKYYNDAMAADPNFPPVYYWLYTYYYERDVNKARDYLNKYIALADPSSKNCYLQASLLYVSQLYKDAITQADQCISQAGDSAYPNLYGLKAYSYDKMGDSINAKKYFDEFFQKVNPDKIGPNDYETYGQLLLKFPGNDSLAEADIDKAVALDTLKANKMKYLKTTAELYAKQKNYGAAGKWYTKILGLDSNYGKVELYYAGYDNYLGSNYKTGDSIFKIYQNKYPDDILGWYLGARCEEGIDSTGAQGLAKDSYNQVIAIGDTSRDTERVKPYVLVAYRYMLAYAYNIQKDVCTAKQWNDKILVLDPTDANALQNKDALAKAANAAKCK
ncbi:MAG TPA: tetratricopeptide repeat protein [Chitinophagaceae bacterium]|nr:tetratricopeptide repeat protein [Chitinophagaceae bacterium]